MSKNSREEPQINKQTNKLLMSRVRKVVITSFVFSAFRIQEALQRVNREDLANAVGMAFDNDLPFVDSAFAPKAKFLNEI